MYELLCGVPLSYYHRTVFTSHTILHLPDGLSMEAQSLLTQLLTYEPSERLGAGKDGIEEIKRHPYFKHIDWQYIYDSWTVPD
nr:ribosomal protein S6 kinase-like 1 [Helicoverpa armigera]